ncbi:MAG: efflux RND transporter periplasmic adaptor subunit [Pseudanabaenaceae cyanobacterium]
MHRWSRWLILVWLVPIASCGGDAPKQQSSPPSAPIAVDVAIATAELPTIGLNYMGTTAPIQEVIVRSRIEGRLLELQVNAGDRVQAGQVIARLDDTNPATAVLQSEAEVLARESEVAQVRANIRSAQARVEEAKLNVQRSQADADRLSLLAKEGAVPQKTADDAQIALKTARQSLRAAEAQVLALQQAAESAASRVASQRALVRQQQERASYTTVTAPIAGVVLQRLTEPGNLLFAGNEIVKLGDLEQIKVMVMVSELEIGKIPLNTPAVVKIPAFPDRTWQGKVSRIAPSADPVSRQLPVEITVDNADGAIASGQLARVEFTQSQTPRVVVPLSALPERRDQPPAVFVLEKQGEKAIVRRREVKLGEKRGGRVEILAGLKAGTPYVVRSGGKLNDGDEVRLSALSEIQPQAGGQRRRPQRQ